ncbi:MAG TPA: phosphocholine cytidylyltransferase family protein [Micropepsaceae bacterium]|jgi:choline kinase
MKSASPPLTAIILAAGVGRRLGAADGKPKVLLEFGGKTLLQRHLEALHAHGVTDIALTVGHQAGAIRAALEALGYGARVACVENTRYREGSLVSLWAQRARLQAGSEVVLMDGDVLYDSRMIGRLLGAAPENVLLVDREIEPGDEPVKICFRDGRIVDFRKKPDQPHDWHGESVGFFRFSPSMAQALAGQCGIYVEEGRANVEYEEAVRDLLLREPSRFGVEDISDLPWTEIDFDADVARARDEILPQL